MSIVQTVIRILARDVVPTDDEILAMLTAKYPDSAVDRRHLAWYKTMYRVGALPGMGHGLRIINQPDTGRRSSVRCPSLEKTLDLLARPDDFGLVMFFLDYRGSVRRGTVMDRVKRAVSWACCAPDLPGAMGARITDRSLWPRIRAVAKDEEMEWTSSTPSKASAARLQGEAVLRIREIEAVASLEDPAKVRRVCARLGGFAVAVPVSERVELYSNLVSHSCIKFLLQENT